MHPLARSLLAALLLARACASPLDSFLPPSAASTSGGSLGAAVPVPDVATCAGACLSSASCIAFSVAPAGAVRTCGIVGECYAPNATSCPATLTLSCFGGTFTAVEFASFGSPATTGSGCSAWSRNPACDAPSSEAVVAAACVGQSACSIEVGVSAFGSDPCAGTYKFLAASLTAVNCSTPPPGALMCQLSTYARNFNIIAAANLSTSAYYQRLQPRNDSRVVQAVPWALDVPTGNVTLRAGVLRTAFDNNILYLTQVFSVDDMLFQFRKRAGNANPPGQCHGWDCQADWIEGSIAGLFLMGAGGHLRWVEHPQLRAMMDALIDGIENCTEADGYLAAFTQAKLATDEHPDYTTSWTVHGFLEAAIAGNAKALGMIRRHMNVFNNHTLIPTFLPPDGGNWPWQAPLGPAPPGFVNHTTSGSGTMTGHTVYLIVQGIIHNTLMALSPVGTQADVDLVRSLYGEPWWLEALAARDLTVVGDKQWYAHNYQLTGIEAYLDMYVLTGSPHYLDAVMGAWEMHRDPIKGWIHVGGSLAINEGDNYA